MTNAVADGQKRITLDVPIPLAEDLDAYADTHGVSRSAAVRFAIQFFLNDRPFERMVRSSERTKSYYVRAEDELSLASIDELAVADTQNGG